ncbi:LPXTG cell wall anchor domain-containing protein [Lactococcus lactis]|uniref:LPXTG cell wall anchor domain-containing protein n=2 Tax=Lactococcus lactis TaxID=1358 RepID=A0A552Z8S6_9LACT|nr:LPXTG cell wall anchor domain-containing protein [Lactococcus lactis subsp. lactis]MCT0442028.1 LPXTG cell wall anchor domain-containing protein [Lactococcus lactis subsp. lactis]MCT1181009.1 LPXTG cell wall anchor domain-containing protein [Lactococcus lactis]MCT3092598.1 LPXTG cell wall anchor domain-containing protein [Lactococcus lactis]TRW75885.1 LPXTG cell wall anchor domain-containing protein [Lactococcus lactis]
MFSLNNKIYNQNTVNGNQMFNYSITRLNKDYYSFSFTLPNGEVFASGDKLDWFIIPATLPIGSPQLSQKLSSEIVVGELKAAVNVHDSSIYVGDTWKAEDNFESALDKDGNKVDFNQLTVDDSKVDTSKAGVYEVTYTYDGISNVAKVTVKDKKINVFPSEENRNKESASEKNNKKTDNKKSKTDNSISKNKLPKTGESELFVITTMIAGLVILSISILLGRKQLKK